VERSIRRSPFSRSLEVATIVHLLTRAATVGSLPMRDRALADADLVLRPPVAGFAMLDFRRIESLAETAYAYARDELAKHRPGGSLW
jgi:hypothetical protein